MSQSKFVIIDGNAIIHRAYHALPPMTTKEGLMVNAVYGFTSMLFKVINDLRPDYFAVTFDMAGGSKARLEKFTAYKATRVKADQALYDQIPLTHTVVAALGIPIFEREGYEADDVIGTIVKKVEKNDNAEIYIVTGDMDTLQLVDEQTKVYALRKGLSDIVIYDVAAVQKRYGFGPELVVDYKALRGDASDNIPGVPGIGEKGATELIQKAGNLETIYKKIDGLKVLGVKDGVIKKLTEGKESGFMSKELATLDCQVPELNFALERCRLQPFDREKITALFSRLEFFSLLKRLPGEKQSFGETKKTFSGKRFPKKELIFTEVKTAAAAGELLAVVAASQIYAARAVATGDVFSGSLTGLALVVQHAGFYVTGEALPRVLELFASDRYELVGHDLKRLLKAVKNLAGIMVKNKLFDCMIASYLLNPGNRAHDAASIILKVLGKELPAGNGQESLFGVDGRMIAHELFLLAEAAPELKKELVKVDNLGLLETLEMPLEPVLAEMELNGVAIDDKKLSALEKRVKNHIKEVSKAIYTLAGEEFNISSPVQLREVLFEKLEIPAAGIKKGKTGLSTGAEQLEKMRGLHPIIDKIETHRELCKLDNTYISVLPNLINKTTGRIHTTFNQAVTATGRLSSSDPNLQNIPIRTDLGREIRSAFVAEEGNVLVSADYSQIELRIVASLAQDKKMMEIFEKDEDIHKATAAAIHGVPLGQVTKEMRRSAKEVNFGVLYGMGAHGLSWRAEIPHHEAQAFIDKYFREFSGVKKYIDDTLAFTKKEGYCETLFGRRRYIPELNSTNYQLRSAAERMAINHPVQGTAADIIKMAMIAVEKAIEKLANPKIKMILQVHDELVVEASEKFVGKISKTLKDVMENVVQLRVPVKVEVGSGRSWGEIK